MVPIASRLALVGGSSPAGHANENNDLQPLSPHRAVSPIPLFAILLPPSSLMSSTAWRGGTTSRSMSAVTGYSSPKGGSVAECWEAYKAQSTSIGAKVTKSGLTEYHLLEDGACIAALFHPASAREFRDAMILHPDGHEYEVREGHPRPLLARSCGPRSRSPTLSVPPRAARSGSRSSTPPPRAGSMGSSCSNR
jgi:hypothetical protein